MAVLGSVSAPLIRWSETTNTKRRGAEHQVLLTVSIEAQADERCSVELLSAILALNRALHPDG